MSQFLYHTLESRIVGGRPAPEGSVPYMVALTNGLLVRSFVCGGSIITSRHVLTAAHCVHAVFSSGVLSSSLRCTVGTNRWNLGGDTYAFSSNITHENYISQTIKNDIAILVTTADIRFTPIITTVPLSFEYIGGGIDARAAGWGRIRAGGPLSPELLELTVTTITGEECEEEVIRAREELNVPSPPIEPHIELCTFHSPGHGMCNGDSGSALVAVETGEQIGVVSWGFPCARGAPDMFVRVSAFGDWIEHNLKQIQKKQ